MASTDLEQFIRERLLAYDPNMDLTAGSQADTQIIQPTLKRYGADPFTMDIEKFIYTRLAQEFPDMALSDGDSTVDLVVKPARILLEPIVQEVKRVRDNLSFSNPETLTLTEAEALGANLFATRERGDYTRGPVRIYFSAPRNQTITPANYCSTGTGLRYLPTSVQTISKDEMLFNKDGNYYYFDITVVAENPGDAYNVDSGRINKISGVAAAVKVSNLVRLLTGLAAESSSEFIDRVDQEVTERSLTTERGILAVLRKYYPSITRVAVVGFSDPEMQRDVLQGAGIGPILDSGSLGYPTADGDGAAYTRRFRVQDTAADFTSLIGPVGLPVDGYTLTVAGIASYGAACGDFRITGVVDSKTVDVADREFIPWYSGMASSFWMVRKNQLTLSGVPGGTILPGPNGEVTIESGKVHIGGMTDIYVRGASADQGALTLNSVTDDEPLLSGVEAVKYPNSGTVTGVQLNDLVLGTDYFTDDATFEALDTAKDKGLVLQLLDGDAGSYTILDVLQVNGQSPIILTDPAPAGYPLNQRWRLVDVMDIDLSTPRETKLSGGDLLVVQGHPLAQIPSVSDLSVYGIGKGDYLELLEGPDAGVFTIAADTTNNQLTLDRAFTFSLSSVPYRIYRRLSSENLKLPVLRIKTIDILDTDGEPVGSTVPYAHPIDVRSFDFTTPTNSPKIDIRDALVGCVGKPLTAVPSLTGLTLSLSCPVWSPTTVSMVFTLCSTLEDIVQQINAAVPEPVASIVDTNRIAIAPFRGQYTVTVTNTGVTSAFSFLFTTPAPGITALSTNQIRSETVQGYNSKWATYDYDAHFDCVHIIGTSGVVFASNPTPVENDYILQVDTDLLPAVNALVTIGNRAVGVVRAYFLEPTTMEVGEGTKFTAVLSDGSELNYVPDPTINSLRYPPPPSTDRAKDGTAANSGGYGVFTSPSVDFIKKSILPGDELVVDYIPIIGDNAQAGPNIAGLAFATFIVKMAGTLRTIVFANDVSEDLTAVSMPGVEQQLNKVLGANVAKFNPSGFLELEPSYELEVLDGTALGYFWLVFPPLGVSNLSPNYNGGKPYTVYHVGQNSLDTLETFADTAATRQQFKITRPATQRVGTTQMALNKTYAGLYYADFQLMSEGTDVQYNVQHGQKLSVSGHKSMGYYMSTEYNHLSFSTAEKLHLHITPSIITPGASDDPENALHIPGQNLQINYEWSSLVASLQSFITSESERVVNENPIARHLLPYYVRYDLTYRGGATESTVLAKNTEYIDGLNPADPLEAVFVQNIPLTLGATSVSTPINLVAVVYKEDRTVDAEQSTNSLNTGRLAGFFTDVISVQKKTS